MKKQTKIVVTLVAVVALAAVLFGVYFATRPKTSEGAKTITVAVTHADETTQTFTYHTDEEYLGTVVLAEGLVVGEDGEYGLYITSVDGEEANYDTDGAYWALYQNGEYALQGADQTPVTDGDSFSFVYTVS